MAGSDWKSLRATRLTSNDGATLTLGKDDSILVSGKNPESDTYVLESTVPVSQITGIRIEAMPDASLPSGGPGRDYYGNFMIHSVKVEVGAAGLGLTELHPGVTIDDVRAKTGCDFSVAL